MWTKSDLTYHTNFDKDLSDKIFKVFYELEKENCWDEVEPFITEDTFGLNLYYNSCKIHVLERDLNKINCYGSFLIALDYYSLYNE